ncbi:ABC transporter permease [Fulvivirgaceae bacterium PWU4]|uniref:ABC transporter permease n=1 Tax=Chryseosolibacter histidini TaxID=2782349 RepID=A0AAP2GQK3_9BACT|nr:ABC transporter permease [Chryseosolibacter histidini]MBT1699025.1 ABC transporter permease [Chryseosolibacter histidini]
MKKNATPPGWIDSLIDRLAPDEFAEEIRGDLYELFCSDLDQKGISAARRRYVFNGLGFLAKSFFWKRQPRHHTNPFTMLSSYFKMARRSLMAYKGNTVINVLGLVVGIASALVIATVIRYELSFDSFHSDADRIYRMVRCSLPELAANKRSNCRTGISYPVPDAVKAETTGLVEIVSMQYFEDVFVEVPDKSGNIVSRFREERGCVMVEPSFFKIFDFKGTGFRWIAGNPDKALEEPLSVVLTRSLAEKYFPGGNAMGMILKMEREADCKVTGIIEDLPPNTDLPFTVLVSYATLRMGRGDRMNNDWGGVNDEHHTYVKLAPGITPREMEKRIARVHQSHTPKDLYEGRHYLLQPLRDLHFDTRFNNYNGRTISRETILAITLVGLFLLLTAAINYINLATAQSVMRAKEIGLRKVMGSTRKTLVLQLFTETFVVVLIAGVIALVIAELMLINFQSLLNVTLRGFNFTDPFTLLSLLAIVLVVTLFAGIYPSMVMSGFNPVVAMKNRFATEKIGGFSLRKVLVVAQFTITQMLVVGTFLVVAQMRYFQNADMGFDKEAVVTMPLPGKADPHKFQVMEDQLRSQAFVADVAFSSTLPSGVRRNRSATDVGREDATTSKDYVVYEYQSIDPSYIDLYKIRLLAGRGIGLQDSAGENVLINKKLAQRLRLGTPEEAVGEVLKASWGKQFTVVGVIDDFYSNSMKEGADNMLLVTDPGKFDYVSVKLAIGEGQGSMQEAVKQMEKIWTAAYPEHIFSYEFFDENIRAFYVQEEKYAQLFQLFSLIFLLIGCLGLYGLITFVVNRKGKEVALRKVLGATVSNILLMFSREYVQLIVLSFLIAVPVAYYAVNSWLSNFANHITLQWWLFAVPGLLVLTIALLVVISKSMRTANANPVDKLKYE